MQHVGLFFEILFLAFGIYVYLFSIGKLKTKDPKMAKKAEAFRKENATWMRWMALALIAFMSIEVFLNIKSMF